MAVRYSADTEIRLTWDPRARVYRGAVRGLVRAGRSRRGERWEVRRWRGAVPGRGPGRDVSRSYDDAARRLLAEADRWARSKGWAFEMDRAGGRIIVDRVFKAPCPVV